MKSREWLQHRRSMLHRQVIGYNEVGFEGNADIAQGQIDLIDEILDPGVKDCAEGLVKAIVIVRQLQDLLADYDIIAVSAVGNNVQVSSEYDFSTVPGEEIHDEYEGSTHKKKYVGDFTVVQVVQHLEES